MQTENKDVNVTKLVDLVARIPKHLDLHFFCFVYEFLGIFKICCFGIL